MVIKPLYFPKGAYSEGIRKFFKKKKDWQNSERNILVRPALRLLLTRDLFVRYSGHC